MDGRSQLSRKGRVDVALIIQTVHWRPFQRLKHSTVCPIVFAWNCPVLDRKEFEEHWGPTIHHNYMNVKE